MSYKAGFIALIGRPNAGKSTLVNRLVNHKVAIVSNKAQTTRNTIKAILSSEEGQMVFIDTPGIHKAQHEMGRQLNRLSFSSIEGVDLVYYLFDASKHFGKSDRDVLSLIAKQEIPVFLVLNKIDLLSKKELIEKLVFLQEQFKFNEIIPISALNNDNITQLTKASLTYMPEGEKMFHEDWALDYPEQFMITEIIREHILHLTREEIPHSVAVTLDNMKEDKKGILIQASIIAERDSQKGILIGKQGQMLKTIGHNARIELQDRLKKVIFLDLMVKVEPNWRNTRRNLDVLLHQELEQ